MFFLNINSLFYLKKPEENYIYPGEKPGRGQNTAVCVCTRVSTLQVTKGASIDYFWVNS